MSQETLRIQKISGQQARSPRRHSAEFTVCKLVDTTTCIAARPAKWLAGVEHIRSRPPPSTTPIRRCRIPGGITGPDPLQRTRARRRHLQC